MSEFYLMNICDACCMYVDGVLRYYTKGPMEEGNFEGADVKVSDCLMVDALVSSIDIVQYDVIV